MLNFTSFPAERIPELNHKIVAVVTQAGVPVSIGRLRVHPANSKSEVRVEVVFHTENVSCAITIDPRVLRPMSAETDGLSFRYVLPPGDELWSASFGPRRQRTGASTPALRAEHNPANEALVETYPLPPDFRLTGYSSPGSKTEVNAAKIPAGSDTPKRR